jgi:hypothetical protein
LDTIHAFTLGLSPGVEETTETYSAGELNGSSVFGASTYPSSLEVSSERINVGPLGLVVLVILLALDNFRSVPNKKLFRAQTLFIAGCMAVGIGAALSFLKYENLTSLGVGIFPSFLAMTPELGGCSLGICLAVLGLTQSRRIRR